MKKNSLSLIKRDTNDVARGPVGIMWIVWNCVIGTINRQILFRYYQIIIHLHYQF